VFHLGGDGDTQVVGRSKDGKVVLLGFFDAAEDDGEGDD
jgi:hypothetical protein